MKVTLVPCKAKRVEFNELKTIRQFYEIETVKNNWSTRELERQINSLLFERLALSKNKNKVRQLARKGQIYRKTRRCHKRPLCSGIPRNTRKKLLYRISIGTKTYRSPS